MDLLRDGISLLTRAFIIVLLMGQGVVHAQLWESQYSTTGEDLHNVNFFDDNIGWAFGDSTIGLSFQRAVILKTTNQGQTWTMQNLGSDSIKILSSHIFSTNSVIAVGKYQTTGDGAVIRSTDGGANWIGDTTSIPERLFDVSFANSNDGWIVGRNGYVGYSSDGGINWMAQTTNTGEDLFSVQFVDASNGWAVGADDGTGGIILHTSDSGATWTSQSTAFTGDLLSIHVFSPSKAIIVGQGGLILSTNDSGITWNPETSPVIGDLNDVAFVDDSNGWAAGVNGSLLSSNDGGSTWNIDSSGTINEIHSLVMRSNTLGWFCGGKGDIYKYGVPVNVEENVLRKSAMKIYPNPSNDWFNIESRGTNMIKSVTLYDLAGNLVTENVGITGSITRISNNGISPGMYILLVQQVGGLSQKFKVTIQ